MEKFKRSERLGTMTRILTQNPNQIHNLGEFCRMFGAAKSTISEDLDLIASSLHRFGLGSVETVAGAAGGVRFRSLPSPEAARETLEELNRKLSEPGRVLPGGFLYTTDIAGNSPLVQRLAEIIAADYYALMPDLVLTMETKGIPLALMTAHMLSVPLVIARRDSRAFEGPAVKINYAAGSTGEHIETMALPKRSVKPGQKALIVDDFMKGGGTLRGMVDMMHEFSAEVVGISVMVATALPVQKRVDNADALLILEGFDPDSGRARLHTGEKYGRDSALVH